MYWYAAEPLAEADPERALAFGLVVRQDDSAAARVHAAAHRQLESPAGDCSCWCGRSVNPSDADEQLAILQGIDRGARRATPRRAARRTGPPCTASWPVNGRRSCDREATALGVTFGDAAAMSALRELVASQ